MNNKPVAWIGETLMGRQYINGQKDELPVGTALYTHPVKEHFEDEPQAEELHEIMQSNAELIDEEINKLWAESYEDGIAMQQGFTTQQHYFAHLILRKAQEKCPPASWWKGGPTCGGLTENYGLEKAQK